MKKHTTCSEAGRKGGKSKSKKKMEAFKKNAAADPLGDIFESNHIGDIVAENFQGFNLDF